MPTFIDKDVGSNTFSLREIYIGEVFSEKHSQD